jgi:hypothetical protein
MDRKGVFEELKVWLSSETEDFVNLVGSTLVSLPGRENHFFFFWEGRRRI